MTFLRCQNKKNEDCRSLKIETVKEINCKNILEQKHNLEPKTKRAKPKKN